MLTLICLSQGGKKGERHRRHDTFVIDEKHNLISTRAC